MDDIVPTNGFNLTISTKCNDFSDCLLLFYSFIDFDKLRLFVAFPISVMTFILNVLSFKIFMGKQFKNRIYKYLQVYCLNSAFISMFDSLYYVEQRQYGNIGNSIPILIILVYGYNYLQNVSSYFNGLLDCIILAERISSFSVKKSSLNKANNYVICCIGLIFCGIICLPTIFYYKIFTAYALMNSTHLFQFNNVITTDFYNSLLGKIFNYGIYFFKDVLILCIEIVFNIISIFLLRRHLLKKKNLNTVKISNLNNNNQMEHFDRTINKAEEKFTILAIVMTSLSFFQHLTIILFTVYSRVNLNFSKFFLIFCGISYTLKNFANFFLFLFFNQQFRKKIKNYPKKNTRISSYQITVLTTMK